jgi:hypothetical protein
MMIPNVQSNGSNNRTLRVLCMFTVVIALDGYVRLQTTESLVSLLSASCTLVSLIVFKPEVDRIVARILIVGLCLLVVFGRSDVLKSFSQPVTGWQNNPLLPQPRGYVGEINSTYDYLPNIAKEWSYDVEFSATETQIVIVAGYEAKFDAIGTLGADSHCYLLITRGPISDKIDLVASSLEVHNVDSSAKTLDWAAQKVHDLKVRYSGCRQEVDLWVGR